MHFRRLAAKILEDNLRHAHHVADADIDAAVFGRFRHHRLNRVVQRIAEDGIDIGLFNGREQRYIQHRRQQNVICAAIQALFRQHRIQRRIARVERVLIALNLLLHLVKKRRVFIQLLRPAVGINVIAQVVALHVDAVNRLSQQLMPGFLPRQQALDDFLLAAHLVSVHALINQHHHHNDRENREQAVKQRNIRRERHGTYKHRQQRHQRQEQHLPVAELQIAVLREAPHEHQVTHRVHHHERCAGEQIEQRIARLGHPACCQSAGLERQILNRIRGNADTKRIRRRDVHRQAQHQQRFGKNRRHACKAMPQQRMKPCQHQVAQHHRQHDFQRAQPRLHPHDEQPLRQQNLHREEHMEWKIIVQVIRQVRQHLRHLTP